MGPYSENVQQSRRNSIATLLISGSLSEDARKIWEQHLSNISIDEIEYNKRVVNLYGDKSWNQYIGDVLLTL